MRGERASKQHRCNICGGDSWCLMFLESTLCMRVASDRPHQMGHGVGYWHQLSSEHIISPVRVQQEEPEPSVDFGAMIQQWRQQTTSEQVKGLSNQLGVRASALYDLGAAYSEQYQAWGFPMTNGFGCVVGIRLRNYLGNKWAVKGSKSGIFMPRQFHDKIAVIVEGPTDSATVLSMGNMPLGRPSCSGGVAEIIHAIGRFRIERVLIIADNDQDKKRPDGSTFNPGMDGALALQAQLAVPSCMVVLPVKDIRQFVNMGCGSYDLECIAQSMRWHYPTIHETSNPYREVSHH